MFKIIIFLGLVLTWATFTVTTVSAQGWKTHQDAAGFSIEIPETWKVSAASGRIEITGAGMERLAILPLKIESRLDAPAARNVLLKLSGHFSPSQKWVMPNGGWQFGKNGVRAVGSDESKVRETTALWWVNSEKDSTGFFYEAAAPPENFQSLEPTFARVLGSFRVTQINNPATRSNTAEPKYQRWVDPTESAFSLEVPVGWEVSGGIKRNISTASEVVIESPDGQVLVRIGDVNLITQYMELNQTLQSLGYREGQYASNRLLIMRFMSGAAFAKYYVQASVGKFCGNLTLLSSKDRADHVRALSAQGLLPNYSNYTAGEIIYSCRIKGRTYLGYTFAETSATPYQGVTTMWNVNRMYGFLALASSATLGDKVLQQAIATTRANPQWVMGEMRMNQQMAQDFQRYLDYSANLRKETQAERWASMDRISEQRGDLLLGVTRVVDPQTGQAYKVQSSNSYYWIDPARNVIAGTDMPYKPTWDFREMIQTYK